MLKYNLLRKINENIISLIVIVKSDIFFIPMKYGDKYYYNYREKGLYINATKVFILSGLSGN